MNIGDLKKEMLVRVEQLRIEVMATAEEAVRRDLLDSAKKDIEHLRKRCKREIDQKASGWFPIHQISGAEKKLSEVTEIALRKIQILEDDLR